MKRISILLSEILLSTLFVLGFASCQKLNDENLSATDSSTVQISKSVEFLDASWEGQSSDDLSSKSVYESGVGVHLTNTEYMSVYYWTGDKENVTNLQAVNSAATPVGNFTWNFSHLEIEGAVDYNYFFLLPYTSGTALNGAKTGYSFRLSSVQFPSSTSFDPNMDMLIGQAAYNVAKGNSISGLRFKRPFAPFKLTVKDEANVLGDEAVKSISFVIDAEATQSNTLVGLCYINNSDEFSQAKVSSFSANNLGNGVTAVYNEGLSKDAGAYTAWYIVNPVSIAAGTNIKVIVSTDTKTVTRTVAVPSETSFVADAINKLSFNISGEGHTIEESVSFNFTSLNNISELPAPWSNEGQSFYKDVAPSTYPNAINMKNDATCALVLPSTGKKVNKIRVFTHPRNNTSNATLTIKSAEVEVAKTSVGFTKEHNQGGFVDLIIPTEYAESELKLSVTGKVFYLPFITLFTSGEGSIVQEPSSTNDNYQDFLDNGYIEIDGVRYSSEVYTPVLVDCSTLTDKCSTSIRGNSAGTQIIFLDNTNGEMPAQTDHLTLANHVVIVGRYKNNPAEINIGAKQIQTRNNLVFKSVKISTSGNYAFVSNLGSGATKADLVAVTLEDSYCNSLLYIFYDNHVSTCFDKVSINNSILKINGKVGTHNGVYSLKFKDNDGDTPKTEFPTSFTMRNSVVYMENLGTAESLVIGFIFNGGDKDNTASTAGLSITVENNSIYNLYGKNCLVRARNAKNLVFKNNLGFLTENPGNAKAYGTAIYNSEFNESYIVKNNMIAGPKYTDANGEKDTWGIIYTGNNAMAPTEKSNNTTSTDSPFVSADLTQGYFPVKAQYSGMGADYETKLWITK